MEKQYFIIDFDSTFIQVEALEELAEILLKKAPQKEEILQQIKNITNLAMEGKMSFSDSLAQRIHLLKARRADLNLLVKRLKRKVSVSVNRNKNFFRKYAAQIYIVSGGFKEFILPIVQQFGLLEKNVFANSFTFDENDAIIGFDNTNILARKDGKVELIKSLQLDGDIFVIGDGYTDYQLKEAGLANKFYAFTENIEREIVLKKADHVTPSLDEFLYVNRLPMAISYPKNRIHVLLLENIHPYAIELFESEGYKIEKCSRSICEEELAKKIQDFSVLGIRSKTRITPKVLAHANRLMTIGAFCIGTDQIELSASRKKGVAVFNAPYSNTRSVVEMTLCEIIALLRNLFDKSTKLHQGVWDKTANGTVEVRGKKLGIIGYGNIGSQLSVLAEFLGMEVYYYDIMEKLALGNAKKCSTLQSLLKKVDVVSVHVDGSPANRNLISDKEFRQMKDGAIFLNASRGFVVDITALSNYLKNGKLKGAAIDVFPEEPAGIGDPFISELQNLPNVILTPHIGGSTEEAQRNIAEFVARKIIDYINTGGTSFSVNFPNLQLPELFRAHRLIHIHHNIPGMLAQINGVLARHKINIVGQFLKTNEDIGYVITDISREYPQAVIQDLKKIPNTIKFRILY